MGFTAVLLVGVAFGAMPVDPCEKCKSTGFIAIACGLCEGTGYPGGAPGLDGCVACGGSISSGGAAGKRGSGQVRLACIKCAFKRKGDSKPPVAEAKENRPPSLESFVKEAQAEKRAALAAKAGVDIDDPKAIQVVEQRIRRADDMLKALASAGNLVVAIETAGKKEAPGIGEKRCNFFAGDVGRILGIPYFRDILDDKSPDGRLANEIYRFIEKAVASAPSGWKRVTPLEAQALANEGKFVIAVARHKDPGPDNPGHIAVVAPELIPRADHPGDDGAYPWIRDNVTYTLSKRANYRFDSLSGKARREGTVSTVEPLWAAWDPVK